MSKSIHRVIHWSAAVFLIWTLGSFLWISMSFHYGSYVLIYVMFGWFVGLVYGWVISRWHLGNLSKHGEHRIQVKTVLATVIVAVVVLILIYPILTSMALSAGLVLYGGWDFLSSLLAAAYAAQVILYSHWERKHGRIIVTYSLTSNRLIAYPETDKAHDIDGH